MLRRRGLQAIQALLELALEPQRWRSVRELAELQNLPAPMLEQLLLRLRRAGLLEARRGRLGGYRLALPPPQIALNQVLAAVAAMPGPLASPGLFMPSHSASDPAKSLLAAETAAQTSAEAAGLNETAAGDPASQQVTQLLVYRLQRAMERELSRLSLEDLLLDLRSARAAHGADGGLILG
ncbi:MAG TPA: transcriptional regulator [Synechococcales bacterium UBA10510]|nr:transcriptional regulator [Synechococcales bacterium UBA10510]